MSGKEHCCLHIPQGSWPAFFCCNKMTSLHWCCASPRPLHCPPEALQNCTGFRMEPFSLLGLNPASKFCSQTKLQASPSCAVTQEARK